MSNFSVILVTNGVISMEIITFVSKKNKEQQPRLKTHAITSAKLASEQMCDFHVKTETSQSVL